jgi:hypothetical protein
VIELIALFCTFVLIGLYYENRRQTDALVRIAKALEERRNEP